jgi:EAL and modified HD-GYP domain-containing signal transduction protein
MGMENPAYLGRQPIYGPNREIRGYELLYRRGSGDRTAQFNDANHATADVMLKAILEIGLQKVAPEHPVYINHPRPLLEMEPILPPERCVVEVLEDVAADAGSIEALKRLRKSNYRIALDDFIYRADLEPMIRLADCIKLDFRVLGEAGVREQMRLLKGFPVVFLAEKIETEEEFRCCKNLGCALFQGYYLRKPDLLEGRRIPSNRLSVLSLLAECANPETPAFAIASVIARDAALTYGLLRLANSALYRRRSEIRTPAQAVTLLGLDFVFRWATLLAMAGNDDCPAGYLETALQRARMCELLAGLHGSSAAEAYMTGLLSTLDSVLNAGLQVLIAPLPIDNAYKRALLEREGVLGAVLDTVTAYESGRWENRADSTVPAASVRQAFWDAAEYAHSMIAEIQNSQALA